MKELEGIKIKEIAPTCSNCIVVSQDGRAFGRGTNWFYSLSIGEITEKIEKFTQISLLKDQKIINVDADGNHTIFKSSDGKIFACGSNHDGELFYKIPEYKNSYEIFEKEFSGDVKFFIAGYCKSFVFIDCDAPMSPNRKVTKFESSKSKKRSSQSEEEEEDLKRENEMLKKEVKSCKIDRFRSVMYH